MRVSNTKDITKYLKDRQDSSETSLRRLLGNKQPSRTEIELSLFHYCNYSCSFCWQDSKDNVGVSDIKGKSNIVNSYIRSSDHIKDDINITLTGGELFQDGLDNLIIDYKNLILEIYKENKSKQINFTLISNLGFSQNLADKVKNLINSPEFSDKNIFLATSWDPIGRPFPNFYRNLEYLEEYLCGITMVLTKPNIEYMLCEDNSVFERLYEKFEIDFDYYVPTKKHDSLMPSDKNLLDFMYFLDSLYPDNSFTKRFNQGEGAEISCGNLNKITIMPDGNLTSCRQVQYTENEFKNKINYSSNANIINNFMDKNGCLSCEFFSKCPLTCFVMNDHTSYVEELDECLYKKYFKNRIKREE